MHLLNNRVFIILILFIDISSFFRDKFMSKTAIWIEQTEI
jgi:hypothetical protein